MFQENRGGWRIDLSRRPARTGRPRRRTGLVADGDGRRHSPVEAGPELLEAGEFRRLVARPRHAQTDPGLQLARSDLLLGPDRPTLSLVLQRGRQLRAEDFRDFDLILGMDENNVRTLKRLAPEGAAGKVHLFLDYASGRRQDVPDPYHEGAEAFEALYQMLEAGCSSLLVRLGERTS